MLSQLAFTTNPNSVADSELYLWFSRRPVLDLDRTLFQTASLVDPIIAVRGKCPGAYVGAATFQWYLGPQALTIFLLRAAAQETALRLPVLQGGKGSIAACLDMIVEKSSSWIFDLFGCTADGTPLIKKILRRHNAGRRRGGEVAISLNEHWLAPTSIHVFVDGVGVSKRNALSSLADEVEALWRSHKSRLRSADSCATARAWETPSPTFAR